MSDYIEGIDVDGNVHRCDVKHDDIGRNKHDRKNYLTGLDYIDLQVQIHAVQDRITSLEEKPKAKPHDVKAIAISILAGVHALQLSALIYLMFRVLGAN